jgi:Spy/CpxP family protein refolding chaperone
MFKKTLAALTAATLISSATVVSALPNHVATPSSDTGSKAGQDTGSKGGQDTGSKGGQDTGSKKGQDQGKSPTPNASPKTPN